MQLVGDKGESQRMFRTYVTFAVSILGASTIFIVARVFGERKG